MKANIKKPVKYTRGPVLKRGMRLPPDHIRLRKPDVCVLILVNPYHLKMMGSVVDVYVQELRHI